MDTKDKGQILKNWVKLALRNKNCQCLIIDSKSPVEVDLTEVTSRECHPKIKRFSDNIGHLARGGKDGWGRAFCYGLEEAIVNGYNYAVHIEGDSLFRLPIGPIVKQMEKNNVKVASILVKGTKRIEIDWVETGLMFFNVNYLIESNFIGKYNWEDGSYKKYPNTPEAVIYKIIKNDLRIAPWQGMRDDCDQLTVQNLKGKNLDWITHCKPEVFDLFAREALDHGATVGD